ncbi:hypothetical protein [Mucilaginibacter ginsenosidivorax]|uniref:Uncharacterized protein n=1 Tax=Mucilaginibacter ginsenosidivorax TaxID=862126 RepID=A0A5B8W7H3_9SPHI|nr:hypothetical protein [Mucilaginibacter ginsenosidivorax]QEC79703.1 hypothetical protein FSB76_28505 [Mucilaginibacter ginsenosidivorax]
MNAGQWIGKLKDGFYTVTFVNPNSMLGSTTTAVRKAEIQGYALQYLSLIQVRAISNLNLNAIYADLKSQYDIGVASSDKPTRTLKKLGLYCLIGFLLIAILIVIQILSYRK